MICVLDPDQRCQAMQKSGYPAWIQLFLYVLASFLLADLHFSGSLCVYIYLTLIGISGNFWYFLVKKITFELQTFLYILRSEII